MATKRLSNKSDTFRAHQEFLGNFREWNIFGNGGDDIIDGARKNDIIDGGPGNDRLSGRGGADRLDGGTGRDTMAGGSDRDYYIVDNVGDRVIERQNKGFDTIETSVSFTLPNHVEELVLNQDAGRIAGFGNNSNNTIRGNNSGNTLLGFGGFDALVGGNGADFLDGGAGSDIMQGGKGDDEYVVDTAKNSQQPGDRVAEGVNSGSDTVLSLLPAYTLDANVENLKLIRNGNANGTGNALDNRIEGNKSFNLIFGDAGDDTIFGNSVADSPNDAGDALIGGFGDDIIVGSGGDDLMSGDQNNDRLFGGGGKDTLIGYGQGNEENFLFGGGDADTFVLGNQRQAFHLGDNGFTSIIDFKSGEGDKIQVHGSIANYRLESRNIIGGSALDTLVFFNNDYIGVAQDTTNVSLNRDFVFVG